MAFLDNSGDIILDAVLTDTGRKRMAEGNFRITKFALGDEEIDYSLYNYNDTRGSAYFDVDILSSPVMEACTDNAAGLKSKLLSIPRTDFTFLPVVKLAEIESANKRYNANSIEGTFMVPVDSATIAKSAFQNQNGVLYINFANFISLHQGIDNTEVSFTNALADYSPDLVETQYIVEFDTRLGSVANTNSTSRTAAVVSYIDDDKIGSYFFTLNQGNGYVSTLNLTDEARGDSAASPIAGSRGTKLDFSIIPTTDLTANDFLFLKLGGELTIGSDDYYYIDTHARVMGATTGYRVDIPVRFIKLKS